MIDISIFNEHLQLPLYFNGRFNYQVSSIATNMMWHHNYYHIDFNIIEIVESNE
jgi:hypothetical protein